MLAGFPVVDRGSRSSTARTMRWTRLKWSFKIAGSMALKEGAKKAGIALLEPIMSVEVVTPED